jgi:hypothetical protein
MKWNASPVSTFILAIGAASQSAYASSDAPIWLGSAWAAGAAALVAEFALGLLPASSAASRWLRILTFMSAALVAGAYAFFAAHPSILISFANERPYVETDAWGYKWVRVRTKNTSRITATCRATLTELRKLDGTSLYREPLVLSAAHHGDDGREYNTLYEDDAKYFNLLTIDMEPRPKIKVASSGADDLPEVDFTDGSYIFHIQIAGEKCGPIKATVHVSIANGEIASAAVDEK